jgi:hypothetical protein
MFYWVEMPLPVGAANRLIDILSRSLSTAIVAVTAALLLNSTVWAEQDAAAKSIEFWNDFEETSLMNINHDPWQALLNKYLDDQHPSGISRFNYAAVTPVDYQRLVDYLDYMQKMEPRQLNRNEQLAYWVNLFNGKTVQLAVQAFVNNDEITSIREVRSGMFTPGPWERKSMEVSQQELSLDDIEHGVIRPHFNDPRVHYVLSSAALGSPNLLKTALNGENNEQLLQAAETSFLAHPRAVRVEQGELILSSIFEWHATDFADSMPGLLAYLRQRVPPELAPALNAASDLRFEYDWSLNSPDSGG